MNFKFSGILVAALLCVPVALLSGCKDPDSETIHVVKPSGPPPNSRAAKAIEMRNAAMARRGGTPGARANPGPR